ncbi:hypothetical protein ACHAXT_008196 [Thalassiosira profunda]
MALRSQSIRIARALARGPGPSVASTWRPQHRPLVAAHVSARPALSCNAADIHSSHFSSKPEEAADAASSEGEAPPQPPAGDAAEGAPEEAAAAADATSEESKVADLEKQIKDLKDNLLRSLAEQENTRRIAQRDVANAKSFAISSFAKSLLDTSDNLSRALDAVPEELRHDHDNHSVLANLYEGISMTDDGLTKAFAKNGLVKFGERGDKFDPNKHEALFEYPDPEGEPGNVGQVMKIGFMLNERVVRPAEVGVVKAP